MEVDRFRALDDAVAAACEFLAVSRPEFYDLAAAWKEVGPELWAASSPETFYTGWTGAAGASAVAANVLDQFSRPNVWSLLYQLVALDPACVYLDYGCGTAAVSFPFLGRCEVAVLLDVPNHNQEFIRWRVERQRLSHVAVVEPEHMAALPSGGFSLVACIDVLEHLAQPTAVFAELRRVLRTGGMLLLRAPWARDDEDFGEHIPEAPRDWHAPGGGAEQLAAGFEQVAEIADGGAYRKRA